MSSRDNPISYNVGDLITITESRGAGYEILGVFRVKRSFTDIDLKESFLEQCDERVIYGDDFIVWAMDLDYLEEVYAGYINLPREREEW